MLEAAKYNEMIENAYEELAPHKICAYIYDLANAFNHFYHETKILAEEKRSKETGYIALLILTRKYWSPALMFLDSKHQRECNDNKVEKSLLTLCLHIRKHMTC